MEDALNVHNIIFSQAEARAALDQSQAANYGVFANFVVIGDFFSENLIVVVEFFYENLIVIVDFPGI